VLAGVNWQNLSLGRGEVETIAAAAFFAGQILWLARPEWEGNNANHFSLVMFATMAAICSPVALLTSNHVSDLWLAWVSWPAVIFLLILTLPCTLGSYMMMNYWQRHVTPVLAGLIYCLEPVFTSAYALFLPAIFSVWAEVNYPNEILTPSLIIGGAFILTANLLALKPEPEPKPVAPG
jgi:drug/metabolite transporter (DMT)-like permease